MDQTQDFIETLNSIKDSLEMKQEEMILGIDYKDNISLGGELTRKSVFVVKIQDEDGKIKYLVSDKDLNRIASIANNGRIELSPRERELWEQFIGKEGEQTPEQKKYYDFDKEYFSEEYREEEQEEKKDENNKEDIKDEKEQEKNEKENKNEDVVEDRDVYQEEKEENQEEQTKKEVAKSLDIKSTQVKAVIKIEDRENFGKAIDKKLYVDTYIVKYGKNKVKLMQGDSKGNFKEISGLKYSDFSMEVLEQLHLNKPSRSNATIKKGDITTIRGENRKDNFVIVREKDPNKGIAIRNSENNAQAYTFDDRNIDNIRELKATEVYKVSDEERIEAEREVDRAEQAAKEAIIEAERKEDEVKNANENEIDNVIEEAELAQNEAEDAVRDAEDKRKELDEEDEGRTPWGDAYDRMSRH